MHLPDSDSIETVATASTIEPWPGRARTTPTESLARPAAGPGARASGSGQPATRTRTRARDPALPPSLTRSTAASSSTSDWVAHPRRSCGGRAAGPRAAAFQVKLTRSHESGVTVTRMLARGHRLRGSAGETRVGGRSSHPNSDPLAAAAAAPAGPPTTRDSETRAAAAAAYAIQSLISIALLEM